MGASNTTKVEISVRIVGPRGATHDIKGNLMKNEFIEVPAN